MAVATYPHSAVKIGDSKDIDMSGQKITNMAEGAATGEAVAYEQIASLLSGIKALHPDIQILAAMDELTYSGIAKSGNNYVISGYTEVNPTPTGTNASNVFTYAMKFVAGATASILSVGLNISAAVGGTKVRVGVYSDNAGMPVTLLGSSVQNTISNVNGWLDFSLQSPVAVTSGTTYWVAFDSDTLNSPTNRYKSVASGDTRYQATGMGTPWSDAGPLTTGNDMRYGDNTGIAGNILSMETASDAAILAYFKLLGVNVSNGTSSHATPVQAEIYANHTPDVYTTPLDSTKFTIAPTDPTIQLIRQVVDASHDYATYITASSGSQTAWNMTVAGGMPALPAHDTILATQVGVASILLVEKSILGTFADTVILTEGVDYMVDYSARTATRVNLTSGTGIVNAQSKLRISWVADIVKMESTNNTALKLKVYLNRTNTGETSPSIQPLSIGTAKYLEMQYGT